MAGRPQKTEEEKQTMLLKLEPYLKSGLSVRKALLQSQISNTTFYAIMDRDAQFREQINIFRQFIPIMLNSSIVTYLQAIIKKQNDKVELTKDDLNFLKWFALNSNVTKGEYGERKEVGLYDPEAEIQRIAGLIDEVAEKSDEPKK